MTFYSPPPRNNELLKESADVLQGTSQTYDEVIPSALPVSDTGPIGLYNQLGRAQLESLYYSKCNQMKDMEQQINLFQQEQDKKVSK